MEFGARGQDSLEVDSIWFLQSFGWVRIHRVTVRAAGGRGPMGCGLPPQHGADAVADAGATMRVALLLELLS